MERGNGKTAAVSPVRLGQAALEVSLYDVRYVSSFFYGACFFGLVYNIVRRVVEHTGNTIDNKKRGIVNSQQ